MHNGSKPIIMVKLCYFLIYVSNCVDLQAKQKYVREISNRQKRAWNPATFFSKYTPQAAIEKLILSYFDSKEMFHDTPGSYNQSPTNPDHISHARQKSILKTMMNGYDLNNKFSTFARRLKSYPGLDKYIYRDDFAALRNAQKLPIFYKFVIYLMQ